MSDDDPAERARQQAQRRAWSFVFAENVPHGKALGITIEDLGDDWCRFVMPYDLRFVGNPETGVLHGGVITALLDGCSGIAVFARLAQLQPIATLDLRIDYLRPAEPGKAVRAHAHCYHMTRNVAFTRAVAYHEQEADPIASAVATFMVATKVGAGPRGPA